jgi:hypothetical protein
VDRTSGDEVGGPYATRQDAERAMGSFDKSPAELDVVEQDEESDGDDESTSKEGAKHASGPEGSEFVGGGTPATSGDPGPSDPGVEPHGQPEPQEGVVPQSTKPSQMPSEGGGDGGMDMNSLPTMPGSPQFDPGSFSTDPIGQGVNAVAALIAEENPGLDTETVRKVARKVVGRLVEAEDWGWGAHIPHIEDPLAHRHPLHFLVHERARRAEERRRQEQRGEGENAPGEEFAGHQRYQPEHDDGEEPESTPAPDPRGGLAEHEIPDLSSFDRPQPKKPDYWWMREASAGSLPGIEAAWGWQPQMTEDIEDPLADKAPQSKDKGTDDKDSGDSSLPHVPKMPDLPGGGGGAGEAAGAAGGAGEAGGAAALAEEALPLLLV